MNKTEQLKSEGKYHAAGYNAFFKGEGPAYGCHYGMKSDRDAAIAAFHYGYAEADAENEADRLHAISTAS